MFGHTCIRLLGAAILLLMLLSACQREPQNAAAPTLLIGNGVVAETTLLAIIPDEHEPTSTDTALDNKAIFRVVFHEQGRGVAYVARIGETNHLVYNSKVGMPVAGIDQISISPDGKRLAYSAMADGKWGMFVDDTRALDSKSVGDPVFSPDSKHIAYQVKSGKNIYIAVDRDMHELKLSISGKPLFSADSQKIAYVEHLDTEGSLRLVVSDLAFTERELIDDFGERVAVSPAQKRLAAISTHKGKKRVLELGFDNPSDVTKGKHYDEISDLVYGADGVAFVAKNGENKYLVLGDKEELLPKGQADAPPVVRPGGKGVGIIMSSDSKYFLHQAFSGHGKEQPRYDMVKFLAYSTDGNLHAYCAKRGDKWFVVVNGKEGPAFDIAVTPVFSPDSKRLVYRVRDRGKRFVVVADTSGKVIRKHSAYEMVFQPVFTADGKSVAYGVKDGKKLIWKVESLY